MAKDNRSLLRRLVPAPEGPSTVGPGADERSAGVRIHDPLHANATLGPAFVLLLAVLILAGTTEGFLEPRNLR